MKCAIYCRVSTDEQVNGYSIDAQLNELKEYAKKNNYSIYDEYIDAGYSGGLLHRPALDRLLQDANNKCFNVVIFVKLDRWFRSVAHYYKIQEILETNNINWIATQEDYETITSSGKFKVNIMLSVSQQFKEATSERVKSVFDYKLKVKKEVRSGVFPYGYKIENKKYVIDPEKAEQVIELFKHFDISHNLKETTIWWNNTYNSKTDNKTIRRRLTEKKYIGIYEYKGTEYDDYFPQIIDTELFDRVSEVIVKRKVSKSNTKRDYIFTSLVYCGECGCKCTSKTKGKHKYYYCRDFNIGKCAFYSINETILEQKVLEQLSMEETYNSISYKSINNDVVDNTSSIRTKQNRLKDLYIDGVISKEEFNSKYNELEKQIIKPKKIPPVNYDFLLSGTYLDLYNKLDSKHKNNFYRDIIDTITINRNKDVIIKLK